MNRDAAQLRAGEEAVDLPEARDAALMDGMAADIAIYEGDK